MRPEPAKERTLAGIRCPVSPVRTSGSVQASTTGQTDARLSILPRGSNPSFLVSHVPENPLPSQRRDVRFQSFRFPLEKSRLAATAASPASFERP